MTGTIVYEVSTLHLEEIKEIEGKEQVAGIVSKAVNALNNSFPGNNFQLNVSIAAPFSKNRIVFTAKDRFYEYKELPFSVIIFEFDLESETWFVDYCFEVSDPEIGFQIVIQYAIKDLEHKLDKLKKFVQEDIERKVISYRDGMD